MPKITWLIDMGIRIQSRAFGSSAVDILYLLILRQVNIKQVKKLTQSHKKKKMQKNKKNFF